MENRNEYLEQEAFQKRLKEQLCLHRKGLGLTQHKVAESVGKSLDTYQRWESTGKCLTDIFSLLSVFQALEFSTTEIIDVLGLPPLTLSEIKAIYQDEYILKSIKGNGICSSMRENCRHMDDFTLGKLLVILMDEQLKRLENGHKN